MAQNGLREVRHLGQGLLVSLAVSLFVFLVILPLTSMFTFAFEDGPEGFWADITTQEARNAFTLSIMVATLATLINLGVGLLLAVVLTRYRFPGRQVLKALVDMPIAIPTAVVGLALMMLYGPGGMLGAMLEENGIQVIMAMPGVLLAHVFVTFPFMVRALSVSLEKVDMAQEEAALTLGATRMQTFSRVVLPSIKGGVVAGTALTFTRSLGEFGATLFIAGGMLRTGPLYIYYLSDSRYDFGAATSVAIVLMLFPFVLLLALNALVDRMEGE